MITVTDTITGASVTCGADDLVATLDPWYPDAPADVLEALGAMQRAITGSRHPETSELEALLRLEWHPGGVAS